MQLRCQKERQLQEKARQEKQVSLPASNLNDFSQGVEPVAKTNMKEGTCRKTRTGRGYCKRNGQVRFVKGK
jgi:hypothetical protein